MGKPPEFDASPSAKRAGARAGIASRDNATRDIASRDDATRDDASKTPGCDDASASGTRAGDLAVVQPKPRDPRRP